MIYKGVNYPFDCRINVCLLCESKRCEDRFSNIKEVRRMRRCPECLTEKQIMEEVQMHELSKSHKIDQESATGKVSRWFRGTVRKVHELQGSEKA